MRTTTWNTVGTEVQTANNVHEVLDLAGLNYEVEKVPAYLEDGTQIPNLCCTKKVGTNDIFGPVSSKYEIIQNEDAFSFVNNFVSDGMEFVKAGEAGNIVYIIAKFPDRFILDDAITPYLIFQNSHAQASAVRFTISPLRVICQNQFNWAFSNASNKVSIRHTITANDKLIAARDNLLMVDNYLNQFATNAELLANNHIDDSAIARVVDTVFAPEDHTSPRSIKIAEEKKSLFYQAYNTDDNTNFRNTTWGLVNAYSDYITHRPMLRDSQKAYENRFIETTLGADNISRFVDIVEDVA